MGIFIIAAMSLNLLLGYHRPAFARPRGVLRHRRLRERARLARLRGAPHRRRRDRHRRRSRCGSRCWSGRRSPGRSAAAIGRLAFKVRGAYFVIVSISFAEVVRLVAVNWVELTQGPMALNNIPPLRLGVPGLFELSFLRKPAYLLAGARGGGAVLRRHPPAGALAGRPRHDRAARERAARASRSASTSPAIWCSPPWCRRRWPAPPARSMRTTSASSIPTSSCSSTPSPW